MSARALRSCSRHRTARKRHVMQQRARGEAPGTETTETWLVFGGLCEVSRQAPAEFREYFRAGVLEAREHRRGNRLAGRHLLACRHRIDEHAVATHAIVEVRSRCGTSHADISDDFTLFDTLPRMQPGRERRQVQV